MIPAINIIRFFEGVFGSLELLAQFLNTPLIFTYDGIVLNPSQQQLVDYAGNFQATPFQLLSIGLIATLTITLALHVWHLLKLIF